MHMSMREMFKLFYRNIVEEIAEPVREENIRILDLLATQIHEGP